jgi:polygalacturonase
MTNDTLGRRKFLVRGAQGALAMPAIASVVAAQGPTKQAAVAPGSAKKTPPTAAPKPVVTLNVRDFGATGDGQTKDTAVIQQALDRCGVLGGGEVVIPAGKYSSGSIFLRSNVTLRLEKDASLVGTADFADFAVSQVRWEGKWIQGHLGLVSAIDADHIGIVGPGSLIGNPALGGRPNAQNPLRHPCVVEFIHCNDVRLEDFTTSNRLMWSIHPTYCQHVSIKNLTVNATGGNGDGVDIDSCKHVVIDGCKFSTGDDCISLKSGRGEEAYKLMWTTEDVLISNCTFEDAIFACIGIGSELSGGIRNARIERCKFIGAKTHAIYIKSRAGRGAFIEDISANDIDVSGMQAGFLRINVLNSGIQDQDPVPGDEGIPSIKNLRFTNVRVTDTPMLVDATAIHPKKPLDRLTLSNISGTCAKGIYLANMERVQLSGIHVKASDGPLLNTNNVTGTGLTGAAKIDAPKLPDPIPAPAEPYKLH